MHKPLKNVYDVHGPITQYCCAVKIFEHSTTEVTSRYLAVCQFRAKQTAECRFRPPKTSEEEKKCVASAIPR